MSDRTGIEWTDSTWNPVRGCSRVSEGCRHCYAEQVAARFSGQGMPYEGLAKRVGGEARWTGVVRLVPEKLDEPLRWKRPRRIFVNSMSDLFHEGLSFEQIAAVFGVMLASPLHVHQVLTKRAARALEFCAWIAERGGLGRFIRSDEGRSIGGLFDAVIRTETIRGKRYRSAADPWRQVVNAAACDMGSVLPFNVWLGVSVENQATADERVPLLLQTPAAVRFVSYEPALGPVDFEPWLWPTRECAGGFFCDERSLDWIIVGGESGPGARPFDVQWARSVVQQCDEAGVHCFVKQLGAKPLDWTRNDLYGNVDQPRCGCREAACAHALPASPPWLRLTDPKGGDWQEWPEDLRVRQFPEAHA